MSGRFLDIPNEKIVADFKKLGILPTAGNYYRIKDRYSEEKCCPITCQLASEGIIDLDNLNNITCLELYLENLSKEIWPDLNEKDDESTNLSLFLYGFDNVTIQWQSPYLKKGRELRELLFNSDKGAIS